LRCSSDHDAKGPGGTPDGAVDVVSAARADEPAKLTTTIALYKKHLLMDRMSGPDCSVGESQSDPPVILALPAPALPFAIIRATRLLSVHLMIASARRLVFLGGTTPILGEQLS
jgi:hypothetical protein